MTTAQASQKRYKPIEDYGVIGNSHACALVSKEGDLDFMCYPRLDSPSLFAALLDEKKGGFFRINVANRDAISNNPRDGEEVRAKAFYYPDTNVLMTRLSSTGICELWDFMPISDTYNRDTLVRSLRGIKGKSRLRLEFRPRFNFARTSHRVEKRDDRYIFIPDTETQPPIAVITNIPVRLEDGDLVADFDVCAHEHFFFILENALQPALPYTFERIDDLHDMTVSYWRQWVNKIYYKGRWRGMVIRSALTLKLLYCREYGSMVAAGTLGLPEALGGTQNWDYRYAWIRDSSFVIYCFVSLGLKKEALHYMRWIQQVLKHEQIGNLSLQPLYRLDGSADVGETILDHFEGYCGSRPVRLGNGAVGQLQLDVYGELMDAVNLYDQHVEQIHHEFWLILRQITDMVCDNWNQPDYSIWEIRAGKRDFLYSRLMCWICLDRAIKLFERRSVPAEISKWKKARNAIYEDIFKTFWSPERQAFVQSRSSNALDASVLMMPLTGFISPHDPLWLRTFDAIEKDLIEDTFVYRYRVDDSDIQERQDNTFSICTFWYADCLARMGRLLESRFVFEKMLGYANHLGLYSEELGPNGEMLGNFPQAFTHLGLISTAFNLSGIFSGADRQERRIDL